MASHRTIGGGGGGGGGASRRSALGTPASHGAAVGWLPAKKEAKTQKNEVLLLSEPPSTGKQQEEEDGDDEGGEDDDDDVCERDTDEDDTTAEAVDAPEEEDFSLPLPPLPIHSNNIPRSPHRVVQPPPPLDAKVLLPRRRALAALEEEEESVRRSGRSRGYYAIDTNVINNNKNSCYEEDVFLGEEYHSLHGRRMYVMTSSERKSRRSRRRSSQKLLQRQNLHNYHERLHIDEEELRRGGSLRHKPLKGFEEEEEELSKEGGGRWSRPIRLTKEDEMDESKEVEEEREKKGGGGVGKEYRGSPHHRGHGRQWSTPSEVNEGDLQVEDIGEEDGEEEGEGGPGSAGRARMTNSATQTPQEGSNSSATGGGGKSACESECSEGGKLIDQEDMQGSKQQNSVGSLYHGAWPMDRSLWHSGPSSIGGSSINNDIASVMSFTSSVGSMGGGAGLIGVSGVPMDGAASLPDGAARRSYSQQQLGAKVEMVYGLLSMLGTHDKEDMSRTLLAMSSSPDSCIAMRQSGCLPLLVQLLHGGELDGATRRRAARALHNVVHSHADDKRGRREARVLRLLEQVREYCDSLSRDSPNGQRGWQQRRGRSGGTDSNMSDSVGVEGGQTSPPPPMQEDVERHPGTTIAALMKLSFDEEHRHAMCQLGGLHAVAELIQVDHEAHGSTTSDQYCVMLRRYAGMALTNLTFGDGTNKALLCSFRPFMIALVAQLESPSEDLRQVTASVLRNLSWRADAASKQTLREVGAVSGLMRASMEATKESTLKSILSALWNLSAHCSMNKADICAVEGALAFLVEMLSYKSPSKTLAIIENAGGILRNISSLIAVREDYRQILREHECLKVLLQQLKSPSLTIVSNACGTLWNLSARCGDGEDQRALLEMGAMSMLRSLVHSKHKMISMGSSAALKNLLSAQQPQNQQQSQHQSHSHHQSHHNHHHHHSHHSHPTQLSEDGLPSLQARKRRALQQELDQTLAETCENIEPSGSPPPTSGSMTTPSSLPLSCTSGLMSSSTHILPSPDASEGSPMTRSTSLTSRRSRHRQQIPTRVGQPVPRSESRESVTSTRSDSACVGRSGHGVVRQHSLPPNGRAWEDSGLPNRRQRRDEASSELTTAEDGAERQERGRLPDPGYGNGGERDCCSAPPQPRVWPAMNSDSAPSQKAGSDDYRRRTSKDESAPRGETRPTNGLDSPSNNGNRQFPDHKTSYSPLPFHGADNKGRYSPHKTSSPHSKYTDYVYVEDEMQDQPVDYSLKYSEDGTPVMEPKKGDGDKIPATQEGRKYPACGKQIGPGRIRRIPVHGNESSIYGVYTETDLDNPDQPTNYSLRYAEGEDPDLGSKGSAALMPPPSSNTVGSHRENESATMYYERNSASVHDDTVMTYCTEGTPYETPCNFSTATSMSDLRETAPTLENVQEEPAGGKEIKKEKGDDGMSLPIASPKAEEDLVHEHADVKEEKDFPKEKVQLQSATGPTSIRQCESSGLLTPEKPVQYGVEGTPVCFSRVSSLSSLHSVDARGSEPINGKVCGPDEIHQGSPSSSSGLAQVLPKTPSASPGSTTEQVVPGYQEVLSPGGQECAMGEVRRIPKGSVSPSNSSCQESAKVPSDCGQSPGVAVCARDIKEEMRPDREGGKVVTFGGADHYAEETPLMFSRCSSLGSLSSFEQHSIHDDRSSVISDFSRRTSGVVSPSELPDSPTQTVPSSPRHSKAPVDFTNRIAESAVTVRAQPQSIPVLRHGAGRPLQNKSSVFEDDVAAFKEEDTPIEFSTATSLSSLTIDDEPKISHDAALKVHLPKEVTTKCSDDRREGVADLGQSRSTNQNHCSEDSSQEVRDDGPEEIVPPRSQEASSSHPAASGGAGGAGDEDDEGMEKQDNEKEKREDGELAPVSEGEEGDENDEDMLAACINIGMQNNRHRQRQYNNNKNILRAGRFGAIASTRGRPSGIPVKAGAFANPVFSTSPVPASMIRHHQDRAGTSRNAQDNMRTAASGKPAGYVEVPAGPCEDAVSTYCTEGTPANISHAGSHSDLSVLSLPDQMRDGDEADERGAQRDLCNRDLANEEIRGLAENDKNKELDSPVVPMTTPPTPLSTGSHQHVESSDDSSSFSGDNDNILAECIQSAMPKARPQHRRPQQPPMITPPAPVRRKATMLAAGPRRPQGVGHLCGPGVSHGQAPPVQHKYGIQQSQVPQSRDVQECEQRCVPTSESGANYQKALRMPIYAAARDEMETYATEGSPNTFSNATSLSDLTINSSPEGAACLRSLRRMIPPVGGTTTAAAAVVGHAVSEGSPACDTPIRYATEDTPLEISHAASLSSLSIGEEDDEEPKASSNSGSPKHGKGGSPHRSLLPRPVTVGHSDPSSEGRPGSSNGGDDNSEAGRGATYSSGRQKTSSLSEEVVTVLSRNGSLSSLSVDSLGAEPTPSEQALLEQCIHSAMPKSKSDLGGGVRGVVMAGRRPIGGNTPHHSHQRGALHSSETPSLPSVPMHRLELCNRPWDGADIVDHPEYAARSMEDRVPATMVEEQSSKNGSGSAAATTAVVADEVVGDITKQSVNGLHPHHHAEGMDITTARLVGASTEEGDDRKEITPQETICPPAHAGEKEMDPFLQISEKDVDSSPESSPGMVDTPSSGGENLTTGESPSEGPSDSACGTKETASSTGSTRDSGSGRGQKVHDMKQSYGSNTWNEDSPNSVSFPSISISAPLISSFRSDLGATQGGEANISELEEIDRAPSSDEVERVPSGEEERLTESRLIELEAGRLAVAVGLVPEESGNLDSIGPPSGMGSIPSLTTSLSGALDVNGFSGDILQNGGSRESPEDAADEEKKQFPAPKRFECRHTARRTLTTLVRRALGSNNFDDLSAASSSCNSHLENIKPPSMMDEVDMENSMVSVASITSEVADGGSSGNGGSGNGHSHNGKVGSDGAGSGGSGGSAGGSFFELIRPAAAMAEAYAAHVAAYTMSCSMRTSSGPSLSECLENVNPPSTFDELTDPTDKGESTIEPGTETIGSDTEEIGIEDGGQNADLMGEISEGTATPGRSDEGGSAGSTPKKKRDSKRLTPKQRRQLGKERFRTYTIAGENIGDDDDITEVNANELIEEAYTEDEVIITSETKAKTPKQRRQEDRERFLTRTLQPEQQLDKSKVPLGGDQYEEPEANEGSDVFRSRGIPKLTGPKTLRQKRAEAKERFLTHTICESPTANNLNVEAFNFEECLELDITAEELEVLKREANLVVSTINATRKVMGSESSASDEPPLIDCETLSLVSDESDSESGEREARRLNGMNNHVITNEMDCHETSSSESEEEGLDEEGNRLTKIKGPRIVKPDAVGMEDVQRDMEENTSETNSPKPVRGRRRALYSSPAKTQRKASSPSPVSSRKQSPHSQIPVVASAVPTRNSNLPLKVRPTRASALRQTRGGSPRRPARPGKVSSSSSPSPAGSAIASPKVGLNSGRGKRVLPKPCTTPRSNLPSVGVAPQLVKSNQQELINSKNLANEDCQPLDDPILTAPPVKQGTFTKEKPSVQEDVSNPANVSSPTKTRIPLPASGSEETESKKKSGIPATKIAVAGKLRTPTQVSRLTKTASQDSTSSKISNSSGATPRALSKAATMPGRVNSNMKFSQSARKGSISSPPTGIKTSLSNHSLQGNESGTVGSSLVRAKSLAGSRRPASVAGNLANGTPKSGSSSSLNSATSIGGTKESANPGTKKKKEVTSKIANLWKKVEESRTRQNDNKRDNRVWITNGAAGEASQNVSSVSGISRRGTEPIRSQIVHPRMKPNSSCAPNANECRNGQDCEESDEECENACQQSAVVLRRKPGRSGDEETSEEKAKRLSRLGSFVRIDAEAGVSASQPAKPQASAIVPPFNYSPPRRPSSGNQTAIAGVAGARSFIPTSAKSMASPMSGVKRNPPFSDIGRERVSNGMVGQEEEMTTASMRVTTV